MKINSRQTIKLTTGSIKFKNHFKELAVLFKIYADFEDNVKGVSSSDRGDNNSYTEKYRVCIPCRFAYKVVCVYNKFSKSVALSDERIAVYTFIKIIP